MPSTPEPPENSPKDAENAPGVALSGSKPAQEQAEIVAIGLAHADRGVIGGDHGFFNDTCEQIEAGGCGGWFTTVMGGWLGRQRALLLREGVACQFVETNRDGLAKVHRRLARIGRNLHQQVAMGKIFPREAMLLWPEDERDAPSMTEFASNERSQVGQPHNGLFGPAMGERSCSRHQRAIPDCLGERIRLLGRAKQLGRAHCRTRFTPMGRIGGHDRKTRKAEVRHGARHRSYIERIARRDKHHAEPVALVFYGQVPIVGPVSIAGMRPRRPRSCYTANTYGPRYGNTQICCRISLRHGALVLCAGLGSCDQRQLQRAARSTRRSLPILITASGLDKGTLTPAGLLEVDLEGNVQTPGARPSAETALHLVVYRARPDAGAILHVHTVWNTLISARFAARGYVPIEGYEILKGLSGVTTHAHLERVPIIENTQNYEELSRQLGEALEANPSAHGVLLSRHGLYTWGQSVADARRHLEALEFLFQVEERRLLAGQPETLVDL